MALRSMDKKESPATSKQDIASHPAFANSSKEKPRRMPNWTLVVTTLVVLGIGLPAVTRWHDHQLQRNASALLLTAEVLEQEGRYRDAALKVVAYQDLVGPTFDPQQKLEVTQRIIGLVEQISPMGVADARYLTRLHAEVLNLKPTLTKNRRRLIELLLELNANVRAAEEARQLVSEEKQQPEGYRLLADALYADKKYADALAPYQRAIQLRPSDIIAYARLANCHLQTNEPSKAVAVLDRMVAQNPKSAQAYYRRHLYRRSVGRQDAAADLEKALELEPSNVVYLLASGDQSLIEKKFDKAQSRFEQALKLSENVKGNLSTAYVGLGAAYEGMGRRDEAIATWTKGLATLGADNVDLNLRIVEAELESRKLEGVPSRLSLLRRQLRQAMGETGRRPADLAGLGQLLDWVEARYLIAQGRPLEAISFLRSTGEREAANPHISFRAYLALGQIELDQNEFDAAADAYQRAVMVRADSIPARYALGNALALAGRAEESLAVLGRLSGNAQIPLEADALMARQQFVLQANRDKEKRDWSAFERAMAQLKRSRAGSSVDTILLGVSYFAAKEQFLRGAQALAAAHVTLLWKEATQVRDQWIKASLERVEGRWPALKPLLKSSAFATTPFDYSAHSARLWIALAELCDAWGKPKESQLWIDRVIAWYPKSSGAALAASAILARQGQLDRASAVLDKALATADAGSKRSLLLAKSRLAQQTENRAQAADALAQLVALRPNDREAIVLWCETLLRDRKFEELKAPVEKLKALDSATRNTIPYIEGMLLLAQHPSPSEADLKTLTQISEELLSQRPSWSRTHVLVGQIALAKGDGASAVASYKKAIRLGDRRLEVYQKLLSVLVSRGEFRDADEYLAHLRQSILSQPGILPLALQLSVTSRDYAHAEALGRRAVAERPKDADARVWLGQVLDAAGKASEAEAAYREAIVLAPKSLGPRLGLLRFLMKQKRSADAEKIVEEISKNPVGDRPEIVQAHCHALLGKHELAKNNYLQAVDKYPTDTAVLREATSYLLAHGMPEAEKVIRRMQEIDPKDPAVRRALSFHLFAQPDAHSWNEALKLLADQDAGPDLRMRSLLLERLGGPDNLHDAVRLLEELVARSDEVTVNDRFRLAQLYERIGNRAGALDLLKKISDEKDATTEHLAACVSLLLTEGRWRGEAETLLNQLEKAEPNRFRTIRLRARWLALSGKRTEAIALVKGYLDSQASQPNYNSLLASSARVLAELGDAEEADKHMRLFAQRDPDGYQQLAYFLRDQGRGDEAVKLCLREASSGEDRRQAAALVVAASIAAAVPISPEVETDVDKQLAAAIAKNSKNYALVKAFAERRLRQGKNAEAASLYRRCLEQEPSDVLALNNYALALSQEGQHPEAIAQIGRAIDLLGPQLELLDSKGLILLQAGQVHAAINVFHKVAGDAKSSPVHHLHLAFACSRANRPEESKIALDKARQQSIDQRRLSESDRQMLAELTGLERKSG